MLIRPLHSVWALCICCLVLGACAGKGEDKSKKKLTQLDSITQSGVEYMQPSKADTTLQLGGTTLRSQVERRPEADLPQVKGTQGEAYMDNSITLTLSRGGNTLLVRRFVKADFASVVDAEFLKQSILEGLVFDRVEPRGLRYAGSVCYPGTDLYMPFAIWVSADGRNVSLQRIDILEEETPQPPTDE
ncbi:MAG: DUF4738 domain-containing protein [Bacteroides sp.]|nr:DUF4738 domain-containing protein [Bacteroides sp.]